MSKKTGTHRQKEEERMKLKSKFSIISHSNRSLVFTWETEFILIEPGNIRKNIKRGTEKKDNLKAIMKINHNIWKNLDNL